MAGDAFVSTKGGKKPPTSLRRGREKKEVFDPGRKKEGEGENGEKERVLITNAATRPEQGEDL